MEAMNFRDNELACPWTFQIYLRSYSPGVVFSYILLYFIYVTLFVFFCYLYFKIFFGCISILIYLYSFLKSSTVLCYACLVYYVLNFHFARDFSSVRTRNLISFFISFVLYLFCHLNSYSFYKLSLIQQWP